MTHEQLLALVESASPEGASQLAGKLGKAASTITKIGDDLMTYTKGLHWQGEGGDAFRTWGTQSASATLYLGQYSEVASRWMGVVAEAIAEAKASMPPASDTTQAKADLRAANKSVDAARKAHNDPDAAKVTRDSKADAAAAQKRIEAAHAEAVQRMRKLAQTYQQSAQQVNGVTPPTFAPPASHAENPGEWVRPQNYETVPGSGSAHSGGAAASGPSIAGGGPGGDGPASGGGPGPVGGGPAPVGRHPVPGGIPENNPVSTPPTAPPPSPEPAAMGIDRVTLPQAPHVPDGPPSSVPPTGRPEGTTPPAPGTAPPPFNPSPSNPGPSAPLPNRPTPGVRPPAVPGLTGPTNGLGNRLPRDPGVIGGRPVPPNAGRPTPGIPRSNVFGGDHMQGRPSMGMGTGAGLGAGGTGPARTGPVGGRRLTGEPGGTVGRQLSQPGRVGGRPFTPGGTGLVRGSTSGEPSRPAAAGRPAPVPSNTRSNSSRDEDRRDRPNYLAEEEETWQPNRRRIVPPVVE
ncbi:hypothetical protein [Streptomyces venezuelae]|nr:hypothetical protein [Streptomyces venezuelae]